MSISEPTRSRLDRIHQVVMKRQKTFGKVMLGIALSRDEKNELRVCFGLLNFLSKKEEQLEERVYDYGNLVLIKKFIEVPEALAFIDKIFENQIMKINGWPEIPIKAGLPDLHTVPSFRRWGYISSKWPSIHGSCDIDHASRGNIPYDALAKFELPLYPNGTEAIVDFLQLDMPRDYTLTPRIELLIPDYRARIKNLRLAGNRVGIEAETMEIASSDLVAKFYCKTETRAYTSDIIPIEDGQANYVVEKEPILVEAQLFSRLDKEAIDSRSFDYRYPRTLEGIVIENIEAQLVDLISRGESISVEFKAGLTPKTHIDFMKTVVAFANTNGGTIFLGVDNDARLVGFDEDVKDKITDLIADYCDPPIELQIDSKVPVKDKVITLVRVPEGTKKPYLLRNRGIIIRKGSTDRQITRIELDDIYSKKQQPLQLM